MSTLQDHLPNHEVDPCPPGCTSLWKLIDKLIEVAREPHSHAGTVGNLPVFTSDEYSVGASYIEGIRFRPDDYVMGDDGMDAISPFGYTVVG